MGNRTDVDTLQVLRIINEPTAAALAYGVDKDDGQVLLHTHCPQHSAFSCPGSTIPRWYDGTDGLMDVC